MTVESILESTYDELKDRLNKFNHNAYNVLDSSPGFGKGYYIANEINNDQFQSVKEQIQELEELLKRIFESNYLNIQNKETYLSMTGFGIPLNQAFNSVLPWMISRSAQHSPDKVIQELKSWFDSETHRLLTIIPFACDYRFPPDEIHNFKVDDLDLSICSLDTMKDNRINRICFQFAHPEGRIHTASQISLLFSSVNVSTFLGETNADSKQSGVISMRELPYLIKIFGIIENIKILKFNTFEHVAPEVPLGGLSYYRQDFEALSGEIRPNFQRELKALNTINWQRFEQACKSYLTFNNELKPNLKAIIDRLTFVKLHINDSFDYLTEQITVSPTIDAWIDLRIVLELLLRDEKEIRYVKETISTRGSVLCPNSDYKEGIRDAYSLCSDAIHKSKVSQDLNKFNKGVEICSKLIELYLQKGKFPNFQVLDLSRDINKAFE
ncbi:MAG: hypothetical protein ACK481_10940 [Candidatus Melainabacteria bacterium]|jgi:hypothetical protein